MTTFPWRSSGDDESDGPIGEESDADPVVVCEFQDGTIRVYEDRIVVDRNAASRFDDKEIPFESVRDVTYAGRLVLGYLQIDEVDVPCDAATRLSTPVDENTLHFGRGKRECARRARDAILERVDTR